MVSNNTFKHTSEGNNNSKTAVNLQTPAIHTQLHEIYHKVLAKFRYGSKFQVSFLERGKFARFVP